MCGAEGLQAVDRRRPVSVALGELLEPDAMMLTAEAAALSAESLARTTPGLSPRSGWLVAAARRRWRNRWQRLIEFSATRSRSLFTADAENADSPDLGSVCEQASRLGCRMLLIDTFDKAVQGRLPN
ncbi:MAG: (5-formylfuran-3-yl)methyl phosphate synthase [Pirellulaceae bacterium]